MNKRSKFGVALITEASSGIGDAYATRLAERGFDLLLVARDKARLEDLSTQLHSCTAIKGEVMRADLL